MNALSEQAAAWIVRLSGDDPADRLRARDEFEHWKQADPRHAAVAARMERLVGQVHGLRGNNRPARAALRAATAGRRRIRRSGIALTVMFVALLPITALLRGLAPVDYWRADLHSAVGEWSTHTLDDGSELTLGSGSAVDMHFDESGRTVELLRGSLRVDVAPDRARPFRVETEHGSMRALGTAFAVTRDEGATTLEMLESRVEVQAAHGGDRAEVEAGQRVRFDADRIGVIEHIDAGSIDDAWANHQLVVRDQPLADVLAQLARHRQGVIIFDRDELTGIRVSAVLPLDDTDRALQLLAKNFPLQMTTLTRWVVRVERADDRP